MATMYETIMELPLFKGLSHDQISSFLEKTHIHFSKHHDKSLIAKADDTVPGINCIISGKVRALHHIGNNDKIILSETMHAGIIPGADKLFGMDTTYGADLFAIGNVSMMEISKEQYTNLLNAGSIFLLNYLNFLSYRAQLRHALFDSYPAGNLQAQISRLVSAYCAKSSTDISVQFELNSLAEFLNTDIDNVTRQMLLLESRGIIRINPGGFSISDRSALSDSLFR